MRLLFKELAIASTLLEQPTKNQDFIDKKAR
jgi:hypothetical protein